jgi:hypothetical protein
MIELDDLRRRVDVAKDSLDRGEAEQIGQVRQLEARSDELEAIIQHNKIKIDKLDQDKINLAEEAKELRALLFSLLVAIESRGEEGVHNAVRDLRDKLGALLASPDKIETAAPPPTEPDDPIAPLPMDIDEMFDGADEEQDEESVSNLH